MILDEKLDAELKARIPKGMSRKLKQIARARHLKVADVVREALRVKVEQHESGDTK